MAEPTYIEQGATFSACGRYRYRLVRTWDAGLPRVAFVMLNPSTADATQLDPTLRRCLGFARDWGFGSMVIGNLFALRSTDPQVLYRDADPVGPSNDQALQDIAVEAQLVVCGWGVHGTLRGRGKTVAARLAQLRAPHALRLTRDGHPCHPLYLPAALKPMPILPPEVA